MTENEKSDKILGIDELNQYLTSNERFSFTIKEKKSSVTITMKSLTANEMGKINRIIMQRSNGKDAENIVYGDELRIIKVTHAIVDIVVKSGDKEVKFDVEDKIGLENYLRGLDDTIIKSLSLKYEMECARISGKIEDISAEDGNEDELKKN